MTLDWNLMIPAIVIDATAIGMIATTIRERRTGEVVWWAKLPVWPKHDYSDPDWFRFRQWSSIFTCLAFAIAGTFVSLKFLGL